MNQLIYDAMNSDAQKVDTDSFPQIDIFKNGNQNEKRDIVKD